jgi:glycosyltransferase involved in cell wall biosynthesis
MRSLKVLYISSGDLVGSRFNGFDWLDGLERRGVHGKMIVNWNKASLDSRIFPLSSFWELSFMRKLRRLIFQSYLREGIEFGKYPWSRSLFSSKVYKSADLVHLQIVHDGTLDFESVSRILKEKPVVWTWHDPWILTGHCIYPMDCPRFQKGCGECPDLERPFQIGKDLTIQNRSKKLELIQLAQTVHLSTLWFRNLVLESLPKAPSLEILPFGLPDEFFSSPNKESAREYFGMSADDFVIGIRSVREPQKNFKLFENALHKINGNKKICIITLQESGQLIELKSKFKIIEIPWTNDNLELIRFYDALDIFVMPSLYETFGFMGIEAMSRGVPVVGLDGTALSEICLLSKNGYVVNNDPNELARLLDEISQAPIAIQRKSKLSAEHIQSHFRIDNFLDKLVSMYFSTISKFDPK